jgi:IS4 transposase
MNKDTLLSSFGKWVAPINSVKFQEHVDEMQLDKYGKKLTTQAYLFLFLHAQIQQREGLRAIADDALNEDFQQELNLTSISAAQLSRKHRQVSTDLLSEIFVDLVHKIRLQTHPLGHRQTLKIIDSSTISLCLSQYSWAEFRKTKGGFKIHLRLVFADEQTVYPEKVIMTPAGSHDRTQMEALIDEEGAMYVFDRGYMDFEKFDRYCDNGLFFASRLKKNTVTRVLKSYDVASDSPILSDARVAVGTPQKRMDNVVRLIETTDSEGNIIRIITNRFDLKAEEIGDIYRHRWAIELFFKWIKQHVRIKKFYGQTETAVQNQVYLALITYCLMVLIQLETKTKHSLLQMKRWLNVFLWKSSRKWLKQISRRPKRTSKGRQKKE